MEKKILNIFLHGWNEGLLDERVDTFWLCLHEEFISARQTPSSLSLSLKWKNQAFQKKKKLVDNPNKEWKKLVLQF